VFADDWKMDLNTPPDDSQFGIVSEVAAALEMADSGFIDSCDRKLVECQDSELAGSNSDSSQDRGIAYWIMLQRATMLRDFYRTTEAKAIFQLVRNETLGQERHCDGTAGNCHIRELADSTIGLADSVCDEGNIHSAIWTLRGLYVEISASHPHSSAELFRGAARRVSTWGKSLGYSRAAEKLGIFYESLDQSGQLRDVNTGTMYPFPLHGTVFRSWEEGFHERSEELGAIGDEGLSRKQLNELVAYTQRWADEYPYSAEARREFVLHSIRLAESYLEVNQIDDFNRVWQNSEGNIQSFLERAFESEYAKLQMVQALRSLSSTLYRHLFDSGETGQTYLALGLLSNSAAQTLLDEIGKGGVDQAKALEDCMLSALIAVSYDILRQGEDSLKYRERRDAVLREILSRDPSNDLALRLLKRYEASAVPRNVEIEETIHRWNWKITPLLVESDTRKKGGTIIGSRFWSNTTTE
jgi:hypothetical protein